MPRHSVTYVNAVAKDTEPVITPILFKIYWKRQIIDDSTKTHAVINCDSRYTESRQIEKPQWGDQVRREDMKFSEGMMLKPGLKAERRQLC